MPIHDVEVLYLLDYYYYLFIYLDLEIVHICKLNELARVIVQCICELIASPRPPPVCCNRMGVMVRYQ